MEQKLVGFGCDGTDANIADVGLKRHLFSKAFSFNSCDMLLITSGGIVD